MAESPTSPPPEISELLWPGEKVLWWGRSDPLGAAAHYIPDVTVALLWLAYAFDVPPVPQVVEWFLQATVKVGTFGFTPEVFDGALTVLRTLMGIAGLFLGVAGISGVIYWFVAFRRSWHFVTDTRVASGTSRRLTVTYLGNVGLVRSHAGRFGREIFIGVAGLKHDHSIIGVKDADGAAMAIDGALRRLQGGEAPSAAHAPVDDLGSALRTPELAAPAERGEASQVDGIA